MLARLTPGVLARSKQGFGVPIRAWLAGPARPLMDELTTQNALLGRGLFDPASVARLRAAFDNREGDVAYTLFALIAIELWCRGLDKCRPLARTDARLAA